MSEEISIRGEIEQALARVPFQSFVIKLASGDRYEVTRRFQVAVGGSVLILIPNEGSSVFIRLNQIVALEIPTAA
jgi:hypothetical protein